VPQIKTAAAEWERVQQQVRLGQRLVPIYYAVTMISRSAGAMPMPAP
jgi:conjugal transfer ATP-binding protein TraC